MLSILRRRTKAQRPNDIAIRRNRVSYGRNSNMTVSLRHDQSAPPPRSKKVHLAHRWRGNFLCAGRSMVLTSQYFSALLQALNLTQGLYKPIPGNANTVFSESPEDTLPGATGDLGSIQSAQANSQTNGAQNGAADACTTPPYYQAVPVGDQTFPVFDQAKATVYRYRQQQSVNLGSWHV